MTHIVRQQCVAREVRLVCVFEATFYRPGSVNHCRYPVTGQPMKLRTRVSFFFRYEFDGVEYDEPPDHQS